MLSFMLVATGLLAAGLVFADEGKVTKTDRRRDERTAAGTPPYIIQRPGELPVRITTNAAGGFTIQKPGELPTRVIKDASSYVIQPPGQLPTRIVTNSNGGYAIYPPGQLPTRVTPLPNGGYQFQAPGQLPTRVESLAGGGYSVAKPGELPTRVIPRDPRVFTMPPIDPIPPVGATNSASAPVFIGSEALPVWITPLEGGAYSVQRLGSLPVRVTPDGQGGFTLERLGELPHYVPPGSATGLVTVGTNANLYVPPQ